MARDNARRIKSIIYIYKEASERSFFSGYTLVHYSRLGSSQLTYLKNCKLLDFNGTCVFDSLTSYIVVKLNELFCLAKYTFYSLSVLIVTQYPV